MTQGFETVKHELEQKRLQLEQDLAAIRGRAAVIEADLERVHEALGALTGQKRSQKGGQKGGQKKARRSTRASKPATTVQDLQRYIALVREQKPFASAAELEKGVRALVQESGSSLSRFKAHFAEALLTSPGSQGSIAQAEHPSPFEPTDDPQPAPGQDDHY